MLHFSLNALIVNGIRNPFQYHPWRDKKQFEAMFDVLEADIIIFQETKIQRKDLHDDMVLVPGWDCYWSLPRHKKGARLGFCYLEEMLTPRRLLRGCYIYETISLYAYSCRRGYNRSPLPAKLINKLLGTSRSTTNRRLSHRHPTRKLRFRCCYYRLRRTVYDPRISRFCSLGCL